MRRSFAIFIRHHIVLYEGDQIKENQIGGTCRTRGTEVHTTVWFENLKERCRFEDRDIDRKMKTKWILKIYDWRAWTGFICLEIRTCNWFLCAP